MTELRLTRRRILGAVGTLGVGAGGLSAVPPRQVSASVTTYEYVLRVRERGTGRADEVGSLEPAVRGPVRRAVEGEYATDDPPAALREYFDDSPAGERPIIRYEGSFYRLSGTLPVYVVRLEPVDTASDADPMTVKELSECMSEDDGYLDRPPLEAEQRPVRQHHLDPQFRDCVDRNPYLERSGGVYEWSITVDDPGPPYRIRAEQVPARDVADVSEGTVGQWETLPETARTAIETAEGDGVSGSVPSVLDWDDALVTDSLPEAVVDAAERYDYVRRGDTFLSVKLTQASKLPLSVDVAVTDPEAREFDPAWLELSVTNHGEDSVTIKSGAPLPFGMLRAELAEADTSRTLRLWSRSYGDAGYDHVFAGRVEDHSFAAHVETSALSSGATATTRYAVRRNPGRLQTGEYHGLATFRVRRPDGEGGIDRRTFPAVLTITVSDSS